MHLVWLRCSSVEYWEYSPSSSLPSRAPQGSKLADLFLPGPSVCRAPRRWPHDAESNTAMIAPGMEFALEKNHEI